MKKFWIFILLLALIGVLLYYFYPKALDIVTKPSARIVYERQFSETDAVFIRWKQLSEKALNDSLEITLPFVESGLFSSESPSVYGFQFEAKEGEQLFLETFASIDSTQLFMELFRRDTDSLQKFTSIQSNQPGTKSLQQNITENGVYKVIIQPEIKTDAQFQLKIYTQPIYVFPVAEATNKNIQSFWGANRDGGRRSHQGNDIFAPRGTPVLAVTEGRISSTGNRGLGGKQVWLRDGLLGGRSLYYAHLDSIIATTGQRVQVGDTLGLVGNTGNARTTAPHLHFGIYTNRGAIDPLPFIKMQKIPDSTEGFNFRKGKVNSTTATLRTGPATKSEKRIDLQINDTVTIFGKTNDSYHIQIQDSLHGFLSESLLIPFSPN
ncbi:peptidoglycan DD-metalloendopeptidase family protein [Jejudonia soesokkakensis]|uniref:Peptidoglycan DD-metalloendopeptidase family protein n=1 Tax=Jejudonia soesokkakensis TaxID=1323432 RepID=A0ABW2MSW8_9FLAO